MRTAATEHSLRRAFIDNSRALSESLAEFVFAYEASQKKLLRQGEIEVPIENAFAIISPERPTGA